MRSHFRAARRVASTVILLASFFCLITQPAAAQSSNTISLQDGAFPGSGVRLATLILLPAPPPSPARKRTNQPPSVNAGPAQTILLPSSATLQGTVTDDGLPNPPAATTVSWSMVSGPGTVTFSSPTSVSTTATFSTAGSYTLRLTASDSALTSSSDVVITVKASDSPPTADNQAVTTSENAVTSITLTAHDPDGDALTYSIVSGTSHGSVNLSGATAVYTPNSNFFGSDSFTFKANDGLSDSNIATVSITVSQVNQPPVARFTATPTSGAPPLAVNFNGSSSSDVDGTIASYAWNFGDGASASGATTSHTYTAGGTYTAKLTVTDNQGATGSATSSIAAVTGLRFAVIGDYGSNTSDENRVATLVKGWNPDFILTTGDNNYPQGDASTIDQVIGKYYSSYIGNYKGAYGSGSSTNQFWPVLGNHDWDVGDSAYINYFTLPNNERYYDVEFGAGLVHVFAIDSDPHEPDGTTSTSVQGTWLKNALAASTSCFNIVNLHHPPYTTGSVGSSTYMQWPFQSWGADVVLAGHAHVYERLDQNGFPYIVDGLGGVDIHAFTGGSLPPGVTSDVRYNTDFGAMLVTANSTGITYKFYSAGGSLVDTYTQSKTCGGTPPPTNQAPTVNAGPNQSVVFPNPATLQGTVTDDGLPNPPGAVTVSWSVVTGPGTVSFSNPTSVNTTATFSLAGTYTLRLTANDSQLSAWADVTVTSTGALAHFGHVFTVVETHYGYASVVGSSSMPYLNSLITKYGLATNYVADTTPAIDNYFMLTTGKFEAGNDDTWNCATTTGVVSDDNVVRELVNAGKTWKAYIESLPSTGYTGCNSGFYLKYHNPFAYLTDVANSATQKNNMVDFTSNFASALAGGTLPQYSFIVPNVNNDGHDGTLAQADTWLKTNIDPLVQSAGFQQDGLLIILFDYDVNSSTGCTGTGNNCGGQVAAVIISPKLVSAGFKSSNSYHHENVLRLMTEGLGLTTFPGRAATSTNMSEFFTGP
jgi:tartrate-resistant acid phosphatase type 5